MDDEQIVNSEIDELKSVASSIKMDELNDGSWFSSLLRKTLATYTRRVNWEYFSEKYAGLPPDAIADRRIQLAQRYAMIEGGVTSSAYSAAVAATLGSGGGASPLTIPGAVTSFTIDLLYLSRLQLHLAYDLAVLYRHPIDIDDPEDLYDLLRVAFGIKAGEAFRNAAFRLAPEVARKVTKSVVKGPVLAWLHALPIVGKYLLQRNIIKFAIPLVGIPMSMKLNHYTTGQVGKAARSIYRNKLAARDAAATMSERLEAFPSVLLKAIWLVAQADGRVSPEESWLLKALVNGLSNDPDNADVIKEFGNVVQLDDATFFLELAALPDEMRADVYEAACQAAAIDGEMHGKELDTLKGLATRCNVDFDLKKLKALAK